MRRLGPADYRDMPWKNGGGVTRELLRLPHPTDPARFLARLSIATIAAPGPFSAFPGVDRTLMLLEGAGVALTVDGAQEVVLERPWQPFPFPGEAEVSCRLLGGPSRDFNLMVDRAAARATLEVLRLGPDETRTLRGAPTLLLHGLAGTVAVRDGAGSGVPLGVEDTLWEEDAGALTLRSEQGAALVVIHLTHVR